MADYRAGHILDDNIKGAGACHVLVGIDVCLVAAQLAGTFHLLEGKIRHRDKVLDAVAGQFAAFCIYIVVP